jgi:hypothetical protein
VLPPLSAPHWDPSLQSNLIHENGSCRQTVLLRPCNGVRTIPDGGGGCMCPDRVVLGAGGGWTLYPPNQVLDGHLSGEHDGGSWSLKYMCAQHL